jgi:hypothetical protein
MMHESVSIEWLSVETVARDGKCNIFRLIFNGHSISLLKSYVLVRERSAIYASLYLYVGTPTIWNVLARFNDDLNIIHVLKITL